MDVGQLEEAEVVLEKCLALKPDDSMTWALRGQLHAKKCNFEQAEKAGQRPPRSHETWPGTP